uniref:G_PROTEIN_RECEP_F1_2 domain-containing protein n=1 Tax=Rhabditophanes sp. KR3021 TaxID=114890 RepID=A0AC35UFI9_9BILA
MNLFRTIKHRNRIYILVICAWIFSICLSLPLNGSFDPRGDSAFMQGHHCGIFNPMYMLASSIVAFFVPAIIMILTYGYIFYKLKKRLQAMKLHEMVGGQFIGFGADVSNITQTALGNVLGTNPKKRVLISWEKPLLKNIEETAAEHASSLNDSEREQLQTILEAADDCSEDGISMTISESEYDRPPSIILEAVTLRAPSESGSSSLSLSVPFNKAKRNKSDSNAKILKRKRMSLAPTSASKRIIERRRHSEVTKNDSINSTDSSTNKNNLDPGGASRKMRRLSEMISDWDRNSRPSLSQMYGFARRESLYIARKKLAGLKGWALDLAGKFKNKNGIALRREARLTKLVAILLMAFLISQLPFFIINSYKVYKLWRNEWTTQFEYLFHWATLLGYLNSCLNFFIYSVVNQRFRSSFSRLLGLKRKSKRSTTWMLPPKKHSRRKHKRNKRNASPSTDPSEPRRKSSILSKLGITKPKWVKPRIVIEEVSRASQPKISISQGLTTYRQSSDDDGMRRSSSEIICGFNVVPANYESRRSSGMSNSSASLILHDAHQLLQKSESVDPAEIFV